MARELVRALRESGHAAGLIVTPQNRFGQQGAAYLAAWCTDVGLAHEEKPIDQVISACGFRPTPFSIRTTCCG